MSNRDNILSAALSLFNERGSHAVSTNHLAAELGISVGNLYYHFRDKEAIIRELFTALDEAWRTRLTVPDPSHVRWPDVEQVIAAHFNVMWDFRFFYREQVSLRQRDAALARRWTIAHKRGRADMNQLLHALCATLAPHRRLSEQQIEHMTDVCWLLADYWMPFKESFGGDLRRSDLESGLETFRAAVLPMFTLALGVNPEGHSDANR